MMINDKQIVTGVSEIGIDRLISDIYDYAQSCNTIINQIDEKVQSTCDYFKCHSANTFRLNFEKLFEQRTNLNNNILSYSRDLAKVKAHYKKRDKKTANVVLNNGIEK